MTCPMRLADLERQVALLVRAADFLARDPSAGRAVAPMPKRVMGNGLRELDLFLTDIIAEAGWLRRLQNRPLCQRPVRRVYCAAEAWRRAGLAPREYAGLVRLRAAQNRMTFQPKQSGLTASYGLADACAKYSRLAQSVLNGARM